MFLSGLLSGALVIFLLCHKERVLETQLSLEVSAGIALGIGLLCGLVTMLVRSVGLFLTGLLLGLTLGSGALLGTEPIYQPPSAWVPAGGAGGAVTAGSPAHTSVATSIHSSGHSPAGCCSAGGLC